MSAPLWLLFKMSGDAFTPEQAAAAAKSQEEKLAKSREAPASSSAKLSAGSAELEILKPMEDAASGCGTVAVREPLPVGLLSVFCTEVLQSAVNSLSINASPLVPSEASALAALEGAASASASAMGDAIPRDQQIPDWPHVSCKTCGKQSHWQSTRQEQHKLERCDDDSDSESVDIMVVWYYCAGCVAEDQGITTPEAFDWIVRERAKERKVTVVKNADSRLKSRKRVIVQKQVTEVFRPAARAIMLKQAQMLQHPVWWRLTHKQLCDEFQAERDLAKIEMLLEKIDDAKESVHPILREQEFSWQLPREFASVRLREESFILQSAKDYGKHWVEVRSSSGRLLGGYSVFYICRAGSADLKCNTLMLREAWQPRHGSRLRWKCMCCGARYNSKFGMVVEVRLVHGSASLSVIPDYNDDIFYKRARFFGGLLAQTPEELYDLIPTILPQERTCLRKAVAADFWPGQDTCSGVYKLNNEEVFLSLPIWTWVHVCSFYSESDLFETTFKAVDSEVVEG